MLPVMEGQTPVTGTRRLAPRVMALLAQRGMSQLDLARAIGRSQPLVSQFLKGTRMVSMDTLDKIAVALRVEVADLFPREGQEENTLALTPAEASVLVAYRKADAKTHRAIGSLLDLDLTSADQTAHVPDLLASGHSRAVDINRLAGTIAEFIEAAVVRPSLGAVPSAVKEGSGH